MPFAGSSLVGFGDSDGARIVSPGGERKRRRLVSLTPELRGLEAVRLTFEVSP
jgi:hypothetical protein